MLWQRLVFGALMLAAIAGVVALDARVSSRPAAGGIAPAPVNALPITLLAALIIVPATFEMGGVCRAGGHQPAVAWAAFVNAGLVFIPWIDMQEFLGGMGPLLSTAVHEVSPAVIWIAGGILGACLAALARQTTQRAVGNIAVTILLFGYLGVLGSFLVRIRCLEPGPVGAWLVIYVVMTIKSGDIGAYFIGRLAGKHKLAPWLSPAKTVEGAAGAVVAAVLVAVGGMAAWPAWLPGGGSAPLNFTQAAAFGGLMAVAGHLGDLVESAVKRDMRIKDSGRLIPAFGGLMDLMDSLLFAAPIAWLALTLWAGIDYNSV